MSHTLVVILFGVNILNIFLAGLNFWLFLKVKSRTRWFSLVVALFVLASACYNIRLEWFQL